MQPERRLTLGVTVVLLVAALHAATGAAQTFVAIDLGTLGGPSSEATAVSDGQVVGWAATGNGAHHAFSWTQADGMVDLGTLPGGFLRSEARAVAKAQVVGRSDIDDTGATQHAFSWTEAGGLVDLGTFGGHSSQANAVSNGQVVGWAHTSGAGQHAFSWTQAGGMVDLGTLGGFSSEAIAVSNGQVVGWATTSNGVQHAFRWTQADGMIDLGTLGGYFSWANAVSNGQVVGSAYTSGTDAHHAFSWTPAGGMIDLGTLGGKDSSAEAVSNGQVVGWARTSGGEQHAFRWTQADGMIDLGTLGGNFSEAFAVSNGQVVGSADSGTGARAFSWTPAGGMVDMGTLGGFASKAIAVSNGQIVGVAYNGGETHAVLWRSPICAGDCDTSGQVSVDEILTTVNIVLGNLSLANCKTGDANHDGRTTIDDILTAINNALNGCWVPPPTPTPTPTPAPTATATPAPPQGGLYTGYTNQWSGCWIPDYPNDSCQVKFFISAAGDKVEPALLVDAGAPCGVASWEASIRCNAGAAVVGSCATFPISNGHWESHERDVDGATFDLVANCADSSCTGTLRVNSPADDCDTGLISWGANTTGGAAAPVRSVKVSVQPPRKRAFTLFPSKDRPAQ
ncbi:MAG: hypothetical protein U0587_11875 [Candidatus Binatia bacterium]